MRYCGVLLSLVFLFMVQGAEAQRFGARAVLGLNASQIAGDQLAGFDKVGITAGLKGTALLAEKTDLNVEFLYSVRGSRPDIFNASVDPDIEITLQYLDLPVYISYHDWPDEEGDFYKAFALAGLSYGRLIEASTFDQYNEVDADLDTLVDEFNENDISWLLGFGFRLSQRFAISFRYTRSINLLLNATKKELNTFSLRTYFLSFRGEYIF